MIVVLADALGRLTQCPCCHKSLSNVEENRVRACSAGCGEFEVTSVGWDGSVQFTFNMGPWQGEPEDIEVVPVAPHVE